MALPKARAASQAVSSMAPRPSLSSSGSRIVFMVIAHLLGRPPKAANPPGSVTRARDSGTAPQLTRIPPPGSPGVCQGHSGRCGVPHERHVLLREAVGRIHQVADLMF